MLKFPFRSPKNIGLEEKLIEAIHPPLILHNVIAGGVLWPLRNIFGHRFIIVLAVIGHLCHRANGKRRFCSSVKGRVTAIRLAASSSGMRGKLPHR
jgi:hypothetical protein